MIMRVQHITVCVYYTCGFYKVKSEVLTGETIKPLSVKCVSVQVHNNVYAHQNGDQIF